MHLSLMQGQKQSSLFCADGPTEPITTRATNRRPNTKLLPNAILVTKSMCVGCVDWFDVELTCLFCLWNEEVVFIGEVLSERKGGCCGLELIGWE